MKLKTALLSIIFISSVCNATDYYWVGGSGNWSAYATHWATTSGGSAFHTQVPTNSDNVFFDANSFNGAGQIVTVDQTIIQCKNMNWTGVTNSPAFACGSANTLRIFGSLTLVPAMTLNFSGSVNFEATASGQTIRCAGKSFTNTISFDGIGGGWTLQDALTTTSFLKLFSGSLNTNNQTVSGSHFQVLGTSALTMGASVFNIIEQWEVNTSTLTLDAGTSTINLGGSFPFQRNFYGGNYTYYNLNFTPTDGVIRQNNVFNGNVTFSGNGEIASNNTFNQS